LLDEQALHDLALRTGLMRDERLAKDVIRSIGGCGDALHHLHAAGLASATCVNLRLDDDDITAGFFDELCSRCGRLLGRHAGDTLRHRNSVLPVELFCLILVNVHGACLLNVVSIACRAAGL